MTKKIDRQDALTRLQLAGRLIQEARTELKLSPKQFCDKCEKKITPETLSFFERDIAELFKLDIEKKK